MKKVFKLSYIFLLIVLIIILGVKCLLYFFPDNMKLMEPNFISSPFNKNSSEVKNISKDLANSYISIINSIESLQKETYKYKLAYINDDDIPELIIDDSGYSVGIIIYLDGNFYSIAEHGLSKKIENNKVDNLSQLGFPLVYGLSNKIVCNYIPKANTITCKFDHPLISRLEVYDIYKNELNIEYNLYKTRFDELIHSDLDGFNQALSNLENAVKENPSYYDKLNEKYYLNKKQISEHVYNLLTNKISYSLEANCMSAPYIINYIESITN